MIVTTNDGAGGLPDRGTAAVQRRAPALISQAAPVRVEKFALSRKRDVAVPERRRFAAEKRFELAIELLPFKFAFCAKSQIHPPRSATLSASHFPASSSTHRLFHPPSGQ